MLKEFKTQYEVETKLVTFEPGNSSRYELAITKMTADGQYMVVDLLERRMAYFSDSFTDPGSLAFHLRHYGWSGGDAYPIAEYLIKAVKENAYITARMADEMDGALAYKTVWFKDTPARWETELEDLGSSGWVIHKQGVIWNW